VVLVDYGPATRVSRSGGGIQNTAVRTCWGGASGHDPACYLETARRSGTTPTPWRVSRGTLAAANRESLHTSVPLVPGQPTDLTFPLMSHDYTFLAGHRIGVVVLGNLSGYQPYANGVTLTVDTRLSHLELPVV